MYGGGFGQQPGFGGGFRQPPSYGGIGGGFNRPMPAPYPGSRPQPMPPQIGGPVRPPLNSIRPVRPEPINMPERVNDVARPAISPMIQTQGPESLRQKMY